MTLPSLNVSRLARCLPGWVAFSALTAQAPQAVAQQVDEFGAYRPESEAYSKESSRYFSLDLRFGPYLPRVDSGLSGSAHPFKDYFGSTNRFMLGAEFDWLPLVVPDILRVGVGAGVSYTAMSAGAFAAGTSTRVDQTTGFRVMPHWLVGVAKLDVLNRKTPIPVIFVGKLGLANALWWVKDEPSPASAGGVKGRGMSYGAYYGVGAGVDLGFLDPWRTKRMDSMIGINTVYLYGEFYGMELSGFGSKDRMEVGDRTWQLGLSFDM